MYTQEHSGNGPVLLKTIEDDEESHLDTEGFHSKTGSKTGSLRSRTSRSVLGFCPIPKQTIMRTKTNIKRWLNFHVLTNVINKFPEDIIQSDGQ